MYFYNKRTKNTGTIIQNISLTFRYDKTYKYGDINKSLPEVCYAIERMGNKTNDFYVIGEDNIHFFISNYIMNNQWGIGTTLVESSPKVQLNDNFKEIRENDELNIKLDNKETEIQILTDDIKADEVEYKNEIETLRKQNEEYSKQLDLDYVDKNYISKKKIEDAIEELIALCPEEGVRDLERICRKMCESVISLYYVEGNIIKNIKAENLAKIMGPIYYR